jgi:hypothetical protein
MSHEKRRAVEMTAPWKAWKTKTRFSTLPTALGNRSAIPTFPQLRRRVLSLKAEADGRGASPLA